MNSKPLGAGTTNQTPGSVVVVTSDRLALNHLNLSKQGADFIKDFEDLRLYYYNDKFNYCTVGWGHLVSGRNSCEKLGITERTPISLQRAHQLFDSDVRVHERHVREAIKVPLHQKEFDALCSLSFNTGSIKTKAPNLCEKINSGRYMEGANEFLDITNGGLRGLVIRRKAEYKIYLTGIYDSKH